MGALTRSREAGGSGIGVLSGRTGVNIETIRFYEKEGLVPAPPRTEGGHRVYQDEHFRRFIFIRRSRELGFTLNEVRTLLQLADGSGPNCAEARALASDHLREVQAKIADLQRMERVLAKTIEQCAEGQSPACPLLDNLGAS
jgi:MerR family transcriptional regulator, mercuric resistance operon regulatory protein